MRGSACVVVFLIAATLVGHYVGADAATLATVTKAEALRRRGKIVGGLTGGVVRPYQFRHRLRVCNAYPYPAAMAVHRGDEDLTDGAPLAYKACRDFLVRLKDGDRIEFSVGGTGAGTFLVKELPDNDAIMLLVIKRHDTLSTAVSFDSHVFANTLNAQIVVIDTYQGAGASTIRIMDAEATGNSRSEDLRFNSVVAVNSGIYQMVLAGAGGATMAKSDLVALNRECYVVLRTGIKAQQGPSYDQELVVYPRSSVLALMGGTHSPLTAWGATALLALAVSNTMVAAARR
mmetsp:Transcript_16559/g.41422  ORF Transcript_16559/g.41422 Transcript_16559/m.41422 type:complete len:289 (-) Transcript_16559:19-885(-)